MTPIDPLIHRFIYRTENAKPLGRDGRIRINCFVDLLSAVHTQSLLSSLADQLAGCIRSNVELANYDGIVSPKAGNGVLIHQTATRLNLQSGFVRDSILFGRWIEGDLTAGAKVLLADDVSADGELLCEAVANLRRAGIFVDQAFVLIERKEGDANSLLRKLGIELKSCHILSDQQLETIRAHA